MIVQMFVFRQYASSTDLCHFVKFHCILSHEVLSILLSCDHMCSLHAVLSAHMRSFDES
jgi:hypothetical protein